MLEPPGGMNSENSGANSGDTIFNSQCRHSPLESPAETRSMNVGDIHESPLEELLSAHRQENKYGVPRIPLEIPGDPPDCMSSADMPRSTLSDFLRVHAISVGYEI
jgi:hypothetical protein